MPENLRDAAIELDLGPGPRPGEYSVKVVRSAAPVTLRSTTFTLDVDAVADESRILQNVLLDSADRARAPAVADLEKPLRAVGSQLFEALFAGDLNTAYRSSQAVASERGEKLRVALSITAPELAMLPWEALHDHELENFVCLTADVVRHIEAPYTTDPLPVRRPLRILGIVASPRDLEQLNVEDEMQYLDKALDPITAELAQLDWEIQASRWRLQKRLLQGQWHVLHFIGHGDYDYERGEGRIALVRDNDGRADWVDATELANLLGQAKPTPRLVVLNSCASGQGDSQDLFSGTATTLVRRGISAVAAMQFSISDTAAVVFPRAFYTALAEGRRVDEAVRSGRIAIQGLGTLEWVTPILHVRGDATGLFPLVGGLAEPARTPSEVRSELLAAPLGKSAGAAISAASQVALPSEQPVGRRRWRRMRSDTSPTSLIRSADHLAEAVARRETVLLDQLRGGPDTVMDLEFQVRARFRSADTDAIGVMSNIGPYFRQQASPQRLLVVGEPGAGKTVLALRLLLDQLRHRDALTDNLRAETPVPVRVNVAGWDGGGDFTSWMASRLRIDYGLNQREAAALTEADHILPVLDGLDEMDPADAEPDRARVALDRLNEAPWHKRPVVVMCRTTVYERIQELRGDAGLHGATTITLEHWSPIEICDYLEHYREQFGIPSDAWAPVTDTIGHDPDGPVATALRTPWLLGLAPTALRLDPRKAPQLAACHDTSGIHNLLFAALIPAAIHGTHRTGPTRDYTEQKVQTWMHTLALYLERRRAEGRGGTEIALDQVWALAGTRRCRALYALAAGLTVGLVAGLTVGPAGLPFGLPVGLTVGLTVGVTFWLAVGLTSGLPARLGGNLTAPKRFAWRVPGRSRWRRGLVVGLMVGLTVGVTYGLMFGLMVGLVAVLTYGPAVGVTYGLSTNSDERLALGQDARRVIHDDLVAGLAYGLMLGLTIGLLIGLRHGLTSGLTSGLMSGLMFGLWYARAAGLYATASLLFAFTEVFVPRPAHFLEWARNAGLLRVTGIAYQFRHDSYQQWLADQRRSS